MMQNDGPPRKNREPRAGRFPSSCDCRAFCTVCSLPFTCTLVTTTYPHIVAISYIETPKTKSGIRQVPLSRETIQAFQRVMKKRPKTEPFVIDGRSNFLFVNHKGKPKVAIDYNALFVRMVKKYNKHHKDNPLPHITPHTLRHTFCTRLASKNMNPKDLQYIMGHSNISITMNWYAHASIDTAKSEVQRLIA